ncbi:MAG TPA: hypothetical protein VN457_00835 [Chlamydiales bacterium]|nr:hypothetical protein [Chlamydiales bacterium]
MLYAQVYGAYQSDMARAQNRQREAQFSTTTGSAAQPKGEKRPNGDICSSSSSLASASAKPPTREAVKKVVTIWFCRSSS